MKTVHTFLVAVMAMSISTLTLAGHHEKGEEMEAAKDVMEEMEPAQHVMEEMEATQDVTKEMEAAKDAVEEMGAAADNITEKKPKLMDQ